MMQNDAEDTDFDDKFPANATSAAAATIAATATSSARQKMRRVTTDISPGGSKTVAHPDGRTEIHVLNKTPCGGNSQYTSHCDLPGCNPKSPCANCYAFNKDSQNHVRVRGKLPRLSLAERKLFESRETRGAAEMGLSSLTIEPRPSFPPAARVEASEASRAKHAQHKKESDDVRRMEQSTEEAYAAKSLKEAYDKDRYLRKKEMREKEEVDEEKRQQHQSTLERRQKNRAFLASKGTNLRMCPFALVDQYAWHKHGTKDPILARFYLQDCKEKNKLLNDKYEGASDSRMSLSDCPSLEPKDKTTLDRIMILYLQRSWLCNCPIAKYQMAMVVNQRWLRIWLPFSPMCFPNDYEMKSFEEQRRKGEELLESAAAQGHIESQINLGLHYLNRDYSNVLNERPLVGQLEYSEARKWFMMAASNVDMVSLQVLNAAERASQDYKNYIKQYEKTADEMESLRQAMVSKAESVLARIEGFADIEKGALRSGFTGIEGFSDIDEEELSSSSSEEDEEEDEAELGRAVALSLHQSGSEEGEEEEDDEDEEEEEDDEDGERSS